MIQFFLMIVRDVIVVCDWLEYVAKCISFGGLIRESHTSFGKIVEPDQTFVDIST